MIRSSNAPVWCALRVMILLVCFMAVVLPMAALADGTGPEPPIQSPDLMGSFGDGLTTVVVSVLTVLWSMP